MIKFCFRALLLTPLILTAQPAVELSPLAVTADPTETRLPEFSTSTTRLTAEDFEGRQASHLQDSLGMVPNLTFAGGTSRPRYLQLRGVGERSQFASEGPPNFSVGVLMDEIDLSGFAGAISLFDVDSVDVLRGPQPTLYGSRALAGLMVVNSRAPTPHPEELFQFSLGTDDYFEAGFAVGGPMTLMTDEWFYRFTLHLQRQDGFRDNVFLNRGNTNQRQEAFSRFQILYTPDSDQQHRLTLMGAYLNNGYDAFATRGDGFTMFTDEPGEDVLRLGGASLRSRFGGTTTDLISITSLMRGRNSYGYDADWGNDEFWAGPPYFFNPAVEGFRYSFTEQLERTRRQAGQEFRLQNRSGDGLFDDRVDWSGGLVFNWLDEKDDYVGFSQLESTYEALTLGGYGQFTTRLTPGLDLVSSLRVENRASSYDDSQGVSEDVSDWMAGGRLALEAELDEQRRVFLGLSRGFKGGGANANPNLTPDQRIYDPEHVWNLEAGWRSHWQEGRGYLAFTLFHMWRRDLQIGTSIQPDPSDPTTFTFFTDNAAEGTNYGAEIELQVPVAEPLDFFASVGLLETEYSDFSDAGGNVNVEGRDQPYAPNYTFRTGLRYRFTDSWSTQVEVEGKDRFYFSNSHNERSSPYELVHASLRYARETWSVTFWGRNIFDQNYDTRGFFFGVEPPDYPSRLWTMRGDPAQFGVTLRMEF